MFAQYISITNATREKQIPHLSSFGRTKQKAISNDPLQMIEFQKAYHFDFPRNLFNSKSNAEARIICSENLRFANSNQ